MEEILLLAIFHTPSMSKYNDTHATDKLYKNTYNMHSTYVLASDDNCFLLAHCDHLTALHLALDSNFCICMEMKYDNKPCDNTLL